MDQVEPDNEAGWSVARFVPSTTRGLLICTGLIALGFLPSPSSWYLLSGELDDHWLYAVIAILQLTAILPLGLALLVAAARAKFPEMLSRILTWLALPAGLLLSLLFGVFPTLFTGSGPSVAEVILFLNVVLVMMAVMGALLWTGWERLMPAGRALAGISVLIPAIAAVWSLAAAAIVLVSAHILAGGQPSCLAHSDEGPDGHGGLAPIGSVADLRWFSFYTTREFTPHGQLTIEAPKGRNSYVWSPWQMRFDLDGRTRLSFYSEWNACSPAPNFWRSV